MVESGIKVQTELFVSTLSVITANYSANHNSHFTLLCFAGYNSGKISSFESRGSRDPGAPFRHVIHDWSRLEGATIGAFLKALRNTGRHDVVKFLQAECNEHLQPLNSCLPQQVV